MTQPDYWLVDCGRDDCTTCPLVYRRTDGDQAARFSRSHAGVGEGLTPIVSRDAEVEA